MAEHNHKLVLGGVSLTKTRLNRQGGPVMDEVRDELEQVIVSTGYLENAPFEWIGLIFYYGLKNDDVPGCQRINMKYGDLPVTIELDVRELRHADREDLKRIYTLATLKTLIHVGEKYSLPTEAFVARYQRMTAAE